MPGYKRRFRNLAWNSAYNEGVKRIPFFKPAYKMAARGYRRYTAKHRRPTISRGRRGKIAKYGSYGLKSTKKLSGGARSSRVYNEIPFHKQYKYAFKLIKGSFPNEKMPLKGAPHVQDERVSLKKGDPNYERMVITNLHCVGRSSAGVGASVLFGAAFIVSMSNVNDPLHGASSNHPMYHAEWLAHGYDIVYPLACHYTITFRTIQNELKKRIAIFYRIVSTSVTLPAASAVGATNIKMIEDFRASKEWKEVRIYTNAARPAKGRGQPDEAKISVQVENIPKYLKRVNNDINSKIDYQSVFSDSATDIGATEKPTLQVVALDMDSSEVFADSELEIYMRSSHTVLLMNDAFDDALPQMDTHP